MTIASSIVHEHSHPAPLDRLATRLGLALVAWGQRPVQRAEVSREDLHHRRVSESLLSDHELARATRPTRLF